MSLSTTNLAVEVLRPGDDGYDAAARVFYSTGRPALVVRPRDPDEVAAALTYAVRHDLAGGGALGRAQPARPRHQHRRDGDRPGASRRRRGPRRPAPARARRRRRDLGPGGRGARSARLGAHRRRHDQRRRRRPDPGRRDRLDGPPVRAGDRQPGRRAGGDRRRPTAHDIAGRAPRPVLGIARRRRQLRRRRRLRLPRPAGQHRALRDGGLPARRSGRPARPVAGRDASRAGRVVQHPGADAADARRAALCDGAALLRRRARHHGVRGRRRDRAAARAGHGDRGEDLRTPVRRHPGGRRTPTRPPAGRPQHPGADPRRRCGCGDRPPARRRHRPDGDRCASSGRGVQPGACGGDGVRPPPRRGDGRRVADASGHGNRRRRRASARALARRGGPRRRPVRQLPGLGDGRGPGGRLPARDLRPPGRSQARLRPRQPVRAQPQHPAGSVERAGTPRQDR